MNVFYLSEDPRLCAEWSVDSHCVKMILESAQLLSTAHRILDGVQYTDKTKTGRNVQRWRLPDARDTVLYSATHVNHPCAIWCRQSARNYAWLWSLMREYCNEYTMRYGKVHKIEAEGLLDELDKLPNNINQEIGFTTPPSAMDAKYIISEDPIANYRNYYKYGKTHLHKWRKRQPPEWIMEN
jgi:hypothetical protein